MDVKVKEAQQWCNQTYSGYTWYGSPIEEDGITGAGTFKALCKALQYEIGVTGIDGILGAGSLAKCPTIGPDTTNTNLVKIIQCGFWCKGYPGGGIDGIYSAVLVNSAKQFREDAGFPGTDGTLPPLFVKALLNTDAYVLISDGQQYVRNAQQYLNNNYITKLPNWGLIPCNGVPDRNMMKAIIAALQYEEANHTTSGVDGIYGNNTLNKAPQLSQGTSKSAYVKIAQMCLMCMMEINPGFDGVFDSALKSQVVEFQSFYALSSATFGVIDRVTWASLLSSKGDTSRAAKACDCSQILNYSKATSLYNSGYRYVGRYLTGTVGGTRSKAMTRDELNDIFRAGLRVVPIFQEGVPGLNRYTVSEGATEGEKAINAALALGLPEGAIIYFAIDYDVMDGQINLVRNYFRGVNMAFNKIGYHYKVGIYGARNVCTKISKTPLLMTFRPEQINPLVIPRFLAVSSYVSDMSTGFSGNLGYKIPANWAFDQFYEFKYSSTDGTFDLDKVAYSGRDQGVGAITQSNQILPDVLDSYRIQKAREFLSLFGIRLAEDYQFGREVTFDAGYFAMTYKVVKNIEVNGEPTLSWATYNIVNGTLSVSIKDMLERIYGKLPAEVTTNIGYNSSSLILSSALQLGNGTLKTGIGVNSNGEVIIQFIGKEILRKSGTTEYTQTYDLKFVIRKMDSFNPVPEPEYSYDVFAEIDWTAVGYVATAVFIIAGVTIAAAMTGGGSLGVTLEPAMAALAALGTALTLHEIKDDEA